MIFSDMQDRSTNERSKTLIRELYEMSESGAFDNVTPDVMDSAMDFLMTFLDVKVTYEQAARIFGRSEKNIINNVIRKVGKGDRAKGIAVIPYRILKKVLRDYRHN